MNTSMIITLILGGILVLMYFTRKVTREEIVKLFILETLLLIGYKVEKIEAKDINTWINLNT